MVTQKERPTEQEYIELHVLVRKEGKQYASWCPELDVASCGDNVEQACYHLQDAVDLYIETLAEEKELVRVFKERGLKFKQPCDNIFMTSWRAGVPQLA